MSDKGLPYRVSPFGNLRITGYLHLPAAYRSLSRPSSALSAKASTLRSLLLDRLIFVLLISLGVHDQPSVVNHDLVSNKSFDLPDEIEFDYLCLLLTFARSILRCLLLILVRIFHMQFSRYIIRSF